MGSCVSEDDSEVSSESSTGGGLSILSMAGVLWGRRISDSISSMEWDFLRE